MAERYGQFSKLNSNMETEIGAERKKKRDAVTPQPVEQLPKDPDALLNRMNELASSQQFQEEAPVSARKSLAEAMDKANKAYQERASKNEWAEVAQLVGRSLAQLGAAQEGMRTGRDMSKLDFGPGIDYGARTSRAAQDYQQELRNISSLEDLSSQERKELQDAARNKYSRESGVLGKALETQLSLGREKRLTDQESQREDRLANRAKQAEDRTIGREKERDSKEDARLALQERKMQLSEIGKIENRKSKQQEHYIALMNDLLREKDLSSKTEAKLQERYGTRAASAGVDLTLLKAELDRATKPGTLWGTNPDEKKQADILRSILNQKEKELENLRARKEALLSSSASNESSTTQAIPSSPQLIKVQAPDGTIAEVEAKYKDYYISKGGKVIP